MHFCHLPVCNGQILPTALVIGGAGNGQDAFYLQHCEMFLSLAFYVWGLHTFNGSLNSLSDLILSFWLHSQSCGSRMWHCSWWKCDIVILWLLRMWYCGCWECDIVAGGWNLWLSLIRRGWPLSSAVSHYSRFTIIMIRIIIVNSDRTTGALFGWCEPRHFLVFTQPNQCHRITAITNIINATQGYSRN